MTKNKWLLVSVLSTVCSMGGVAAAQPCEGSAKFEKLDTNSDGTVTTAEFEASSLTRWSKSDADGDGKVSAEEMKAQLRERGQEHFAKRDSNGNGSLERTEVEKMPQALFTKLDSDASGALSQAELESGRPKHADRGPRDGELKGLPGDTDEDGSISKAEASANVQKLVKHIDADADGKLTKEELGRGAGHRAGRAAGHHAGRGAGQHGGARPDAT